MVVKHLFCIFHIYAMCFLQGSKFFYDFFNLACAIFYFYFYFYIWLVLLGDNLVTFVDYIR